MLTQTLQFYPSKFERIFNKRYILWQDKRIKTAYLLDFMHVLICKNMFRNKKTFNLSSHILRDRYNHEYTAMLDWMEQNGVLRLKSKWFNGIKCRTYEFRLDLEKEELKRKKNDDKILMRKDAKRFMNNKNMLKKPELEDLKLQLENDLKKIHLKKDVAMDWLYHQYKSGKINKKSYLKNKMMIEDISNKRLWSSWDGYGRFHTPFTVLKKHIRKNFLSVGRMPMVEFDIHNSQPLLLTKIIKSKDPEYKRFMSMVKTGKFYESFHNIGLSRNEIKTCVYRVLFGKNKNDRWNQIFKKVWPRLWQEIVDWKSKNSQENHSVLAHRLQKIESNLIFNKIVYRFKKLHPEVPLITIHDSIMVPQNKAQYLEPIFTEELRKLKE